MTQQYDEQNVSQQRDQSSTDQDTTSNLDDLVAQSRKSTQEADQALREAGQGGQPSDQPVQKKGQQQEATSPQGSVADQEAKRRADADAEDLDVSGGTDREDNSDREDYKDNIANPNAAQGSSSDGDSAS